MTDNLEKNQKHAKQLEFVKNYIEENIEYENKDFSGNDSFSPDNLFKNDSSLFSFVSMKKIKEVDTYINNTICQNKTFKEALFDFIEKKGLTFVDCYNEALVSKSTASKIRNDPYYKPSKSTVIAFAIALKLNLEETQALLSTLGMCLSNTLRFDLAIKALITDKCYDIYDVNDVLYDLGLDPIGIGNVREYSYDEKRPTEDINKK